MPIKELCPLKGLREFDVDGAFCWEKKGEGKREREKGKGKGKRKLGVDCCMDMQMLVVALLHAQRGPSNASVGRLLSPPSLAAGGKLTGPIPTEFATCFPAMREIDLRCGQLAPQCMLTAHI